MKFPAGHLAWRIQSGQAAALFSPCSAFGPFWGFQEGLWKWFSGVVDNALYPVLFLDYLKHSVPVFEHFSARVPAMLGITVSLTYLNYRGLHIVGIAAVLLASFSLLPFLVMGILSIPRIRPRRWLAVDFRKVDWRVYFNSIQWSDGHFAEVGMLIGGSWLKWWIQAAAAMSNMGLFEAEMSSDAFQLLGMSEMGMLPSIFASRSKHGTPTFSILCSATGVIFLSWMTFQEILELLNFLYSIGMLLEFAAFITLRIKKPGLRRPYKVPLQTFGATMLCLPPMLLLILVMCLASPKTFLVSGIVIVVGFLLYPAVVQSKERFYFHFNTQDSSVISSSTGFEGQEIMPVNSQEVSDEASLYLLSDPSPLKDQPEVEIISGVSELQTLHHTS
nr:probable polyamine transporter At3g19553 [Ipomoea batatas]